MENFTSTLYKVMLSILLNRLNNNNNFVTKLKQDGTLKVLKILYQNGNYRKN